MEAIRETGKAPGNAGEQTGTPRKKSGIPKKTGNPEDTAESTGAQEAKHKAGVDARIVRFLKKHQGLQLCGKAERADEAARRAYLKRFPYAVLAELTLWAIAPDFMKFTDNTLGFGKKLIWNNR